MATVLNILFGLIGIAAILGGLGTWVYAFIDSIRREDLKESKLLWIVLLFLVGPIGVLLYGFMENRKKVAYIAIASYVALPVVLVLWGVLSASLT